MNEFLRQISLRPDQRPLLPFTARAASGVGHRMASGVSRESGIITARARQAFCPTCET